MVILVDVIVHCNGRVGIQGQGPKVRIFDTLTQIRVINQVQVKVKPKVVPLLNSACPLLDKTVKFWGRAEFVQLRDQQSGCGGGLSSDVYLLWSKGVGGDPRCMVRDFFHVLSH